MSCHNTTQVLGNQSTVSVALGGCPSHGRRLDLRVSVVSVGSATCIQASFTNFGLNMCTPCQGCAGEVHDQAPTDIAVTGKSCTSRGSTSERYDPLIRLFESPLLHTQDPGGPVVWGAGFFGFVLHVMAAIRATGRTQPLIGLASGVGRRIDPVLHQLPTIDQLWSMGGCTTRRKTVFPSPFSGEEPG